MSKALTIFKGGKIKGGLPLNYGIKNLAMPLMAGMAQGTVGIEVEMEGRGLPAAIRTQGDIRWQAHRDGSLRAENGVDAGGMEYVLEQPIEAERVPEAVTGLYEYLLIHGAILNPSRRCSTHVHLNFSTAKIDQLAAAVALWGTFEEVLVNYCGESRVGNLFCLRMQDAMYSVRLWEDAFRNGNFNFPDEYRYLALNCAAFSKFGSLEVRTLDGTTDPQRIIDWTELLVKLRSTAFDRTILRIPSDLGMQVSQSGGRDLFRQVFEGCRITEDVIAVNDALGCDFDRAVRDGFRRVQPISYALPWEELSSEFTKVYIPNPFGERVSKPPPPMALRADAVMDAIRGVEMRWMENTINPVPTLAIHDELEEEDNDDDFEDDDENEDEE